MYQPTGSVYLDVPRRPSRVPIGPDRDRRTRVAAVSVGLGVFALTVAALITGLRLLVINNEPGQDRVHRFSKSRRTC